MSNYSITYLYAVAAEMNRPKRTAPQDLGPKGGKKLKVSTDAKDIVAFASIAIHGLPSAKRSSSAAKPPPPPAVEPIQELVRKNAGAVSRT